MFQFPAFAPAALCVRAGVTFVKVGFPHSDISGSTLVCQLPGAYRRLPRPSSPLDAKTSAVHPSELDHVYRAPSRTAPGGAAHPRRSGPPPPSRAAGRRADRQTGHLQRTTHYKSDLRSPKKGPDDARPFPTPLRGRKTAGVAVDPAPDAGSALLTRTLFFSRSSLRTSLEIIHLSKSRRRLPARPSFEGITFSCRHRRRVVHSAAGRGFYRFRPLRQCLGDLFLPIIRRPLFGLHYWCSRDV